jgi:ribose/xylose/arabinose/galactoside ABC-type transport system permease subunit
LGAILIVNYGWHPLFGVGVIVFFGVILGAINGFIVVGLKVNPLITTLGMMIALRGAGLALTNAQVTPLPRVMSSLGNLKLGPVFIDIPIALIIILLVHALHTRTQFGRQITAIGNGVDVSARLGIRVPAVTFYVFLLSGFLASIGGVFYMMQVGLHSSMQGTGMEFIAVASAVIGGISLFGGEGKIIPGVIFGVLTIQLIENGLNLLGASPYAYPFVRGSIIFIAMYADSLKTRMRAQVRVVNNI